MLFHANDGCSTASNADKPNICFAATYMKVVLRIVENDDCDELRHVGTGVYNALGKALRHQTALLEDRLFEELATFIVRGMKNCEKRATRLAAGLVVSYVMGM